MYELKTSQTVIDNHKDFVGICIHASNMLNEEFSDALNTTQIYNRYNIFSQTATSVLFYDLYKDLNTYIREYVGDERKIWLQSWLNFLSYDQVENVLGDHGHNWDIHGYISIDPKDTTTEFNKFAIKNKIGNIYIGPGGDDYRHKVINDSKWDGQRITIGFDCTFQPNLVVPNNKLFPLL